MKKSNFLLLFALIVFMNIAIGQNSNSIINKGETERIEKYLASDELEGRKTFSKAIDKAADFISNELIKDENLKEYIEKHKK